MDELIKVAELYEGMRNGDVDVYAVMDSMEKTMDELGIYQSSIELAAMMFLASFAQSIDLNDPDFSQCKPCYDRWAKDVESRIAKMIGNVNS